METNIYFVRHAHSNYIPGLEKERSLSEQGKKDAEKVTQILIDHDIDKVISSPYNRAIQTVSGISDTIGEPVLIEPDFRERLVSTQHVEDFEGAMDKLWSNEDFAFPGGESNSVAQKRGVNALEIVLEEFEGKNIVIGTHGNLMVLMMKYYEPSLGYSFWQSLAMPDIYRLTFENKKLKEITRIWEE